MDRLVIDCATGETLVEPLTVQEEQEVTTRQAAMAPVAAAEETGRANEATIRQQAVQALDAMRAHVNRGTFTAAQRDAALLLVLRTCIGLVRLALHRFDGTD